MTEEYNFPTDEELQQMLAHIEETTEEFDADQFIAHSHEEAASKVAGIISWFDLQSGSLVLLHDQREGLVGVQHELEKKLPADFGPLEVPVYTSITYVENHFERVIDWVDHSPPNQGISLKARAALADVKRLFHYWHVR